MNERFDGGQYGARFAQEIGFAQVYLKHCSKETESDDELHIEVFTKLAKLDSKLGCTASEQLFECLLRTTRWDLIKVRINIK